MEKIAATIIILVLFGSYSAFSEEESTCYGTPEKGRLENGWRLPGSGVNSMPFPLDWVRLNKRHKCFIGFHVNLRPSRLSMGF